MNPTNALFAAFTAMTMFLAIATLTIITAMLSIDGYRLTLAEAVLATLIIIPTAGTLLHLWWDILHD